MTPQRPRALFVAAFLSVALGTLLNANAFSMLSYYLGSRDAFSTNVRDADAQLFSKLVDDHDPKAAAADRAELDAISERRASTLWSRRNALVPLGIWELIVGSLVLLGALRAAWGSSAGRSWGRSTWQLGAIIGVPYEVLEGLTSRAETHDLAARLQDLHSPFAEQLKSMAGTVAPMLVQVALAFFFVGLAGYLSTRSVKSFTETVG